MATIYADARGAILRALLTESDEARYPDPPAEAVHTLVFDEATNAGLVAALLQSTDAYTLRGGVLRRAGQAVQVATEGEDRGQRGQLAQTAAQLRAYLALQSPTQAQTVAAVKALIRVALFLVRQQLGRHDL